MTFPGSTRRATPLDHLQAQCINAICFEGPFPYDKDAATYYDEVKARITPRSLVYDACFEEKYVAEMDGKVVAATFALPYEVMVDGGIQRMLGIAGVVTLPVYRRMGAVRALLNHALGDAYDAGVEWSFLYPFSQRYYEQFGYAMSEPEQRWTFSLQHIAPMDDGAYRFSLYEGGDIADYEAAYARMTGYNLMVRRQSCDYNKLYAASPLKNAQYAYLCRDEAGVPRGYAAWRKVREGEFSVMDVQELIFDEPRTLHALLRFAASAFASHYDLVRFKTPTGLSLEGLCTDYVFARFERKLLPCGMVRAIHPEAALRGARFLGSGEAVLHIEDPVFKRTEKLGLRWLNGTLTDVSPTECPPDAVLPIGAFSQLLLGRYDSIDRAYLPGSEIIHPEKLSGLFYRKPIHINTFF